MGDATRGFQAPMPYWPQSCSTPTVLSTCPVTHHASNVVSNTSCPSAQASNTGQTGSSAACSGGCFDLTPQAPTTSISSCFNVQASEFVPSECNTVGADVQDVGLGFSGVAASNPNVLSINPAFLSDDESDDESGDTIATIAKEKEFVTVADLYHMLRGERAEKSTV